MTGVEFEGKLPGEEIRLADNREATGVVEFEFTPGDPPWLWIPHVTEVTEDCQHLLESFRSDR